MTKNVTKKLSIVIVSYNTREILRECLGKVFRFIDQKEVEVFVVDNSSSDQSSRNG